MSDVNSTKYSFGDLDRRGKFFGLHLPQFVIGWLVVFTLILPVLLWRSLKSHHVEEDDE